MNNNYLNNLFIYLLYAKMGDIEMTPEDGRVAALAEGPGQTIMASNQCGDFPFRLKKMMDPRTDVETISDYDKDVIAYVGARTWNKFRYKNNYTNPTQLKFSNIKTPGATYLVDTKWWLEYNVKITFNDFPWAVDKTTDWLIGNKKGLCKRKYNGVASLSTPSTYR